MKIAVLSGKGGTGKTLVSVNLSYLVEGSTYIDCDVEEPNGMLYYKIDDVKQSSVYKPIPKINHDKCIGCKKCTEFCKFNALAYILDKVRVFKDLCHGCGGCTLVCPENAIEEVDHEIGIIKSGQYESHNIYSGLMNIGEESGVQIISELLEQTTDTNEVVFIDSPPGNGCTVMESIKEADYCILVSEPSIFGLHNLEMVYKLTSVFNKPAGLVINKANDDKIIHNFAKENDINILGEIPMNFELSNLNSNGHFVVENKEIRKYFEDILSNVRKDVSL